MQEKPPQNTIFYTLVFWVFCRSLKTLMLTCIVDAIQIILMTNSDEDSWISVVLLIFKLIV